MISFDKYIAMHFGRAYNKAIREKKEYFTFKEDTLYTAYAYYLSLNLVNKGLINGKMNKNKLIKFK